MQIDKKAIQDRLRKADFTGVFTQELGWDFPPGNLAIAVAEKQYELKAVGLKRGFVVYHCPAQHGNQIPDRTTCLKIEREVTKRCYQHLVVFTDSQKANQLWLWVRRDPGKPIAPKTHLFNIKQSGESLIQKLSALAVSLEEEENLTHVHIDGKVKKAFNLEKVTKKFFEGFQKVHQAFLKFLKGIPDAHMQRWYVSVMLNRLMFIYFIQSKGFLGGGDKDYLRTKLGESKLRGKDRYFRDFLCPLFFDGFAKRPHERSAATNALLGTVPYLNGGLFVKHQIETIHGEAIRIPDAAFEKIFDFFKDYHWHLDERPLKEDNEINPDVLGYIFEKYINQKQMGAYYTKEDITEYIAKNTIIPFLLDATAKKCPDDFTADATVWQLLSDDPDAYIYVAIRKGVLDDEGNVLPESVLPDYVQQAISNPKAGTFDGRSKQGEADLCDAKGAKITLPTESWQEYVFRRKRCIELREKLGKGEVQATNDLITLNLDIRQFAQDAIANCQTPELLAAFFDAIRTVTVLDPTCGSGAFLFAALNILEPLYEACLDRMESFLAAEESKAAAKGNGNGTKPARANAKTKCLDEFRGILKSVNDDHPNLKYFIFKSIIIQNLFGVDIMEEAVEICKLRLFLKLVAQVDPDPGKDNLGVEPLPDIDFNIRAGNTLVGYTTIDEIRRSQAGKFGFEQQEINDIERQALHTQRLFDLFRQSQSGTCSPEELRQAKETLTKELGRLASKLDRYLAGEYGIDADNPKKASDFQKWHDTYRPFHWFVEFYGIMHAGGFQVVIGNPPYVNANKVRKDYTVRGYITDKCPDIYAWCLERVAGLVADPGRVGMIVPLSLGFSGSFDSLRRLIFSKYNENWFSSYGRIPSALFSFDVRVRNTIHLGHRGAMIPCCHTTRLHRWFTEARPSLFQCLKYATFSPNKWAFRIPKLDSTALVQAFEQCFDAGVGCVADEFSAHNRGSVLYYKKTAYNWLSFCRRLPPCFDDAGKAIEHTKFGSVLFDTKELRDLCCLLLNGKLAFTFWMAMGDDFDLTIWMFGDLPVRPSRLPENVRTQLLQLADDLEVTMKAATSFKLNAGKKVGNYNLAKCRHATDISDRMFAKVLGFSDAWHEVELLYAHTVKTDFAEEEEEE
jgi:hypothetical protein